RGRRLGLIGTVLLPDPAGSDGLGGRRVDQLAAVRALPGHGGVVHDDVYNLAGVAPDQQFTLGAGVVAVDADDGTGQVALPPSEEREHANLAAGTVAARTVAAASTSASAWRRPISALVATRRTVAASTCQDGASALPSSTSTGSGPAAAT